MSYWQHMLWPGWTGLVEILVFSVAIYYLIVFLRGTRGVQILLGLIVLLTVIAVLTRVLRLDAVNWLLSRISLYVALALAVIFQPEIRRVLAELGRPTLFGTLAADREAVENILQAVLELSERKIGALIAVVRDSGPRSVFESGVRLDSAVSRELLLSIFYPHTPLHDGGVLICGNRIVAAGCMFPISSREELSKSLGARHRAAVGLSEETDAIVIVVSEETGTISVAFRGRLSRGLDEDRLRRLLSALLLRPSRRKTKASAETTTEIRK